MRMSGFWTWPNWATGIAAIALPTPMPRPPWPDRCVVMDSSHLWWSVSARRRTRLLDGFKRLAAARTLGLKTLSARLLEADERAGQGRHLRAQRHGPSSPGMGGGLDRSCPGARGRHDPGRSRRITWAGTRAGSAGGWRWSRNWSATLAKTSAWGCSRVPTARSLVRLPAGNQGEVLATLHRDDLTADELNGVVDLLLAAPGQSQQEYILAQPRQALEQARHESGWAWDPRLSQEGNRLAKRLSDILEGLGRIETWLRHQGRAGLTPCDRSLLDAPLRAVGPRCPERGRPRCRLHRRATCLMNEQKRNEIIGRWRAGASIRKIARDLGLARNTVSRVLVQVRPGVNSDADEPRLRRRVRGSWIVTSRSSRNFWLAIPN